MQKTDAEASTRTALAPKGWRNPKSLADSTIHGKAMKRKELLRFLAKTITGIKKGHPVRVAIDGVDASGKTSLANELAEELGKCSRQVIRAPIDGFHNPKEIRYRKGRKSPEGYYLDSFDCHGLVENLLGPLGPGGNLGYRTAIFDFRTDSKVDSPLKKADPDSILVFEGVFLLRPGLADCWDLTIFLDVDFGVTVRRASERDGYYLGAENEIAEMYGARYVPGQKLYFDDAKPKEKADIVVDNTDFKRPVITKGMEKP